MKKCYSYIRFSTIQQSTGDSYRRQLAASKKYALDNNLIFDETLTIQDLGVSAYKRDNVTKGALGEFIKAVEQGTVEKGSILLVESLDRISRADVMTALKSFISILESGITIVTLQDSCTYSADSINDNWTQLVISITYMARAHEEIKTKTDRIRSAWKNKADNLEKGKIWTSLVPMWLEVKDDEIHVIDVRVEIVKDIFNMYCSGYGHFLIAKELNKQKVPSFKGNSWGKSAIKKVLNNRAVMGHFTPKMKGQVFDEIPNYYPPIIEENQFYKVKQLSKTRLVGGQKTCNNKLNSLFSGLAFCHACGKAMTFVSRGQKNVNNTHPDLSNNLICNTYRTGKGCYKNSVFYNRFEINVLTMLHELDIDDIFNEDIDDRVLPVLEGKLLEQKNNLKKYEELIEEEDVIPKIVLKKIQKVEDSIESLQEQIENEKTVVKPSTVVMSKSITELQLATSKLDSNEVYELRLKTRQSIQQLVTNISVKAHKHEDIVMTDDPKMIEYNRECRNLKIPTQYFIRFKNDVVRHVMMDTRDPTQYFMTKDRK